MLFILERMVAFTEGILCGMDTCPLHIVLVRAVARGIVTVRAVARGIVTAELS